MKTLRIKSALPIYCCALAWILYGIGRPLYGAADLLACTGVSAAVYMLTSVFFPGRKTEIEEKPDTGNAEVDRQIREGREALAKLREADEAIPDKKISSCLARMDKAGRSIFDALSKDAGKATKVRRFMSYYLPVTVKLMDRYRELRGTGGVGENISDSMKRVEDSLELIASAFEKQLDTLYSSEALDITTDVRVLETMLAGEGIKADTEKTL